MGTLYASGPRRDDDVVLASQWYKNDCPTYGVRMTHARLSSDDVQMLGKFADIGQQRLLASFKLLVSIVNRPKSRAWVQRAALSVS